MVTQKLEQRHMFSQYLLLQLSRWADILLFKKGMQMRLIRICNAWPCKPVSMTKSLVTVISA